MRTRAAAPNTLTQRGVGADSPLASWPVLGSDPGWPTILRIVRWRSQSPSPTPHACAPAITRQLSAQRRQISAQRRQISAQLRMISSSAPIFSQESAQRTHASAQTPHTAACRSEPGSMKSREASQDCPQSSSARIARALRVRHCAQGSAPRSRCRRRDNPSSSGCTPSSRAKCARQSADVSSWNPSSLSALRGSIPRVPMQSRRTVENG